VAGKRAGLSGERSGLWYEFERILSELRPRWALIENVPGLLSSNAGRDFGFILRGMDDLGYGIAWRVLDARFFGVPQRRRRVFIVGCLGDAARAAQVLAVCESCGGHPQARGEAWKTTPAETDDGAQGFSEPADPISAHEGKTYTHEGKNNFRLHNVINGVRRLTPLECERLQGWPDGHTQYTADGKLIPDSHRYRMIGNGVVATVAEWIGHRLMASMNTLIGAAV
jgi:DNA (cytosine-5)-methyltransferase 1